MRMINRTRLIASGIALMLLPAAPVSAVELSQGEMLSASCAGCHGTDGQSPGSIPDISTKSAEFIRMSLEEFKSGNRRSTVMGRHAKGYSDEEIRQIADYLGSKK